VQIALRMWGVALGRVSHIGILVNPLERR
jgi:hypothetical protein